MPTYRQVASDIIDNCRSNNLDDRLSYRFVISSFNSEISYFLRLEAKSREFLKLQNLWKSIKCIELISANANDCHVIDNCKTLLRSKYKIPEAFGTSYGLLIKIFTIAGDKIQLIADSGDYNSYASRRWKQVSEVAYIEDGYLYLVNSTLENVKILLVPINPYDVEKANGTDNCKFALDFDIPYPEYLITLAKRQVTQSIAGITKRVVEDEKGDDNTNQKV